MQLSFAWIGLQLETSYISLEIFSTGTFLMSLFWAGFFCPSFVFVKVVKLLSLSQTFSCRRVFCIVMQHAHTMCTISFMVEYLSKVWWRTVTHTFLRRSNCSYKLCFDGLMCLGLGLSTLPFEVITVPTTYVNETRYSFRLNVTVAELQDMKKSAVRKTHVKFHSRFFPFSLVVEMDILWGTIDVDRCCLELESNPKRRRSDSWRSTKCMA